MYRRFHPSYLLLRLVELPLTSVEHCITLRGQKWKVSPESTGYNPTIEGVVSIISNPYFLDIRRDQISRMNNFVYVDYTGETMCQFNIHRKWGLSGCSNQ